MSQPTATVGKLLVRVINAKNTLALDLSGTSDPYVLSSLICNVQTGFSSHDTIYKTAVIYKTLNPVWSNEEFCFDVSGGLKEMMLYMEMWDEDTVTADDFMGLIKLNLEDLVKTSNSSKLGEMTLPMKSKKDKESKKKRGDLHIQYQFYSVPDLVSVLVRDSLLVKTISRVIVSEEFTKSLMYVLGNYGDLIGTIKDVITSEVEATENPNVLFRTDSLATKLTISAFKVLGHSYLEAVISPLVHNVINRNVSWEVDPSKGVPEADIMGNLKEILGQCEIILEAISNSLNLLPEELKVIFFHISNAVRTKFPSEKNVGIKSVGGFFFLRFVTPCIFSPEAFGIVKEAPSTQARRNLTLISKVLQNLSNLVHFSGKEAYLEPANEFVSSKFEAMTSLLEKLSEPKSANAGTAYKSLFACDELALLRHSEHIYSAIQEKKQQVQFKLKSLLNSHKLIEELEQRCHLTETQTKQESKRHHHK